MYYVRMTDRFMSGWGPATGKKNVLIIACETYEQATIIERNAQKRGEMRYISITGSKPRSRPGVLLSIKTFADMSGAWVQP